MAFLCAVQQGVETRDGLHELDAVLLLGEAFVDLQDGDDALLGPKEVRSEETVDLAVHGVLKEDGREDLVLVERRALDDACAHFVNAREHLVISMVRALVDAVRFQRLGRGAAALVERCDEALVMLHAVQLFLIHWTYLLL